VFSICAAWFLLRLLVDTGSVGLEWLSPDLDDFYVGYTKH
jgi:putative exporter of polyketide antibiotics